MLFEIKDSAITDDYIYLRNYDKQLVSIDKNNNIEIISENVSDIKKFNNSSIIILYNDKVVHFKDGKESTISNKGFSNIFVIENDILGLYRDTILKLDILNSEKEVGVISSMKKNYNVSKFYISNSAIYIAGINQGLSIINLSDNLISSIDVAKNNIWYLNKTLNNNILVSSYSSKLRLYSLDFLLLNEIETELIGYKNAIIIGSHLYVGTHTGLFHIDLVTNKKTKLLDEYITVLALTEDKKSILAGTSIGDIHFVTPNKSIHTRSLGNQQPILDIYADSLEEIYIASQGGLYEIINNEQKLLHPDFIYSVSKNTSVNKLYFGTTSSLLSFDIESRQSNIVFSNNKEIFSIKISNDIVVASSLSEIIIIDNEINYKLTTNHGSQHEYNTPSSVKINEDLILFGGIEGASLVSIEKIKNHIENQSRIVANIDSLLIFNTPIEVGSPFLKQSLYSTKNIQLKYSDYPFTFKFNAPNSNIDEVEYYYQLNGLSDDWIPAKGIESATYTNLSAGHYTFNLYAVDPLTNNKGPIRSIDIEITPPWWLSKQAKLVYFIITLIISAVIVQAILRRREVQLQIAKSEERLKLSLWGSGDEMWDWDIETGQIYRSNIWGSLEFPRDGQRSGESGEESNIHPMDQERVTTALNNHFYGKTDHFEAAYRVKGKSGEWIWILDRAKIVERDEKDAPLRMTGTIKNINNFKHAEEQLRLFERAIANISEGMFILDNHFIFVEVNEACSELSLISREEFIGSLFKFDLYPDSYSEQIRSILHQQGSWSNDVESAKGDGSSFLMELTVDAIYDEQGQLSHYVGVFSDISRRKQQEEELRKLTNNDLLTNLPNRSSLMVTLGNLVKRDTHHTLMVLDLDNFKKINDSMGHQVGDELLIKVAKRIEATVPYHTSIYRLGGDEFAILVDNNPDIGSSAVIANNVIDAFVSPFEITSEKVVVGLSIGIVLYPEDDQNEQALLRKADIAMYHAKSGGGNRYQFYSESINRNAIRQLEVENLIREALRDDLFEVYYQPKIALKTGRMAGMEALVRLNHPIHGLIPPSEFIPLAEENGLIVDIGDLVMKKACFATQKWRSLGLFDGRVAVNLSSNQFALPDLQQRIESILRLTQLPAANLELEITEGTVIKEPEKAIKVMLQLSKMGVSLALDDFGTGYSSLSYLKRFPIHTLKIDKAFVDDIDKSDRDLKMVDSIITIAHNMGLSVVGEGVEDASQLSILKALNCEEIQGYIFSKPVTESDFSTLLQKEFIEPDIAQKTIFAT